MMTLVCILFVGICGNAYILSPYIRKQQFPSRTFISAIALYDLLLCVASLLVLLRSPVLLVSMYDCYTDIIVVSKMITVNYHFMSKIQRIVSTKWQKLLNTAMHVLHLALIMSMLYYFCIQELRVNVWKCFPYTCCGRNVKFVRNILRMIALVLPSTCFVYLVGMLWYIKYRMAFQPGRNSEQLVEEEKPSFAYDEKHICKIRMISGTTHGTTKYVDIDRKCLIVGLIIFILVTVIIIYGLENTTTECKRIFIIDMTDKLSQILIYHVFSLSINLYINSI